jgi:hypothetical protein
MKRVLISLCLSALFPVLAQAQTAPAKPVKKPAATAAKAAEPAKPKIRLMTKDQLRKCLALNEENGVENLAIEAEKTKFEADFGTLKEEIAAFAKQGEWLQTTREAILKEQTEMQAEAVELGKPVERSERAARELKVKDFEERRLANGKRIDEYNATMKTYGVGKAVIDPRIDASNAWKKKLTDRVDEHNYARESWQAECANRPYDEADEVAIKKEWAKEKAAGK